VPEFYILLKY